MDDLFHLSINSTIRKVIRFTNNWAFFIMSFIFKSLIFMSHKY